MNCMTDIWSVFGADQGQIVERAYRYDPDTDRIVERIHDGSDNSTQYRAAACPDDVEWNGSEGVAPWGRLDWQPCDNPFAD